MADEIIVRRRALKYLGLLAATAAGRDFLAAWLPAVASGAQPGTPGVNGQEHHASGAGDRIANLADNYTPKFFKPASSRPSRP